MLLFSQAAVRYIAKHVRPVHRTTVHCYPVLSTAVDLAETDRAENLDLEDTTYKIWAINLRFLV